MWLHAVSDSRAEFIHPSSGPNGPSRDLRSQLISCNSLKPRACVGKMQPSVLEGNLPAIRCTGEKISGGWLHWKGFCTKSAWGCGGSKSKSSAVQVPSPQQGSALGPLAWAEISPERAARAGLLQPGALGTSPYPVGASQLCESCSSSSPMLSARHVLDVDGHGKDVQCPAQGPPVHLLALSQGAWLAL